LTSRSPKADLAAGLSCTSYIHNETVNILTHGLGALYLLPHIYSHLFLPAIYRPTIRWTDKMHFSVRDPVPRISSSPPEITGRG
jgi:predicted membrane channel-forming protein YqfA (hemolysin III family)